MINDYIDLNNYSNRQRAAFRGLYKKHVRQQMSLSHQLKKAKKEYEENPKEENYYNLMSLANERQEVINQKKTYKDKAEGKISINMEGITKRYDKEKLNNMPSKKREDFIHKSLEENVLNKARGVTRKEKPSVGELNSALGLAKRIEGQTNSEKIKEKARRLKSTLVSKGATAKTSLKDTSVDAPSVITEDEGIVNINYL